MDMRKEANAIYSSYLKREEKIRKLQELALDCENDLYAQEENMHPDVQSLAEEGLRLAKQYIRSLKEGSKH